MNPKIITVIIVILLLSGGLWLASGSSNNNTFGEVAVTPPEGVQKKLPTGSYVPPAFFITQNNSTITLEELTGSYIFINFWNTWCPPCQKEMPDLNRLYLDYRDKNIKFLFINITTQEKKIEDINTYIENNNLQIPVYLDKNAEVATTYGIRGIPTTIVINPKGDIIYAKSGPLTYEQASSLLEDSSLPE